MTEFLDRLSLVRGVCESWGNWNDEQRKAACRAIFWLCDQLLEDIDRRCPEEKRSYVRGKILSLQDRAEKGGTSGDFDPIRCASGCDLRHWFRFEQSGPVVAHEQCIEPARARNVLASQTDLWRRREVHCFWKSMKRVSQHPKGGKQEVKRPKSSAEKKIRHASRVSKRSKAKLDDDRAWMDW
jgi:hypothetical protein